MGFQTNITNFLSSGFCRYVGVKCNFEVWEYLGSPDGVCNKLMKLVTMESHFLGLLVQAIIAAGKMSLKQSFDIFQFLPHVMKRFYL